LSLDSDKSLGTAVADVKRLKIEASVFRKKIRRGGDILKYLSKVHNIRLNIDAGNWEPINGPLSLVTAVDALPEPVPAADPPVS
jgi:hypothetical protein